MWKQRLEAVSDLEGPHFSAGMPTMAKYTQDYHATAYAVDHI
jgi:hypothetical protein